jgi:hypothetical protein
MNALLVVARKDRFLETVVAKLGGVSGVSGTGHKAAEMPLSLRDQLAVWRYGNTREPPRSYLLSSSIDRLAR